MKPIHYIAAVILVLILATAWYTRTPSPTPGTSQLPVQTTPSSASAPSAPAAAHTVTIAGFAYSPSPLTVHTGDTVTWTNNDTVAHTVTSDVGLFDSGTLAPGATYSYTFAQAGTVAYHCTFHPNMHGSIIVQ